jgi:hypothetical protein
MNKRGQFFIFSAVIIVSIIFSMATISNYAKVRNEPKNFYDYNYDLRKESNEVLDYGVYSGFREDTNISNFVRLVAEDIRDKDASANFLFAYGNNSTLSIENYGSDVASVSNGIDNFLISGGSLKIKSVVSIAGSSSEVYGSYRYLGGTGSKAIIYNANVLNITILNNTFSFPLTGDKQVIFMTQKEEGEEVYVFT